MAILSAEQVVITALQSAVTLFRQNLSTFAPDIYSFETTEAQTEIETWWANAANTLVIQEGFTNQPVKGLAWNLIGGVEDEDIEKQPIGSRAATIGGVKTETTNFDVSVMIACLGPNRNWLRWSQMLCKWALLYYRQTIEGLYGLQQQKLSLGPMQPAPDDLRGAITFLYTRTVTLNAQTMAGWNRLAEPVLTSASVTVDFVEV